MVKTKTVWAQTLSGASLRIDSYKYKITSHKRMGRKRVGTLKGKPVYKYKYKLNYVPRK